MTAQSHTRRNVIVSSGAAVAGMAALAACGGDSGNQSAPSSAAQTPNSPLAPLSDIPVGQAKAVTTPDGAAAILARRSETEVVGLSAICTHQACTVAPVDNELRCPCHGSTFDMFTGAVKKGPASEPLPAVPVKVQDGQILTA